MKRFRLMAVMAIMALVGLSAVPIVAHAQTNFRTGTSASVAKDEAVDATAYLAGATVTVAGDVRGDLYCAGQNVDITGTVEGDVICAGQTINISGNVLGNVRVAGQTVTLSGPVARSVTAFGQSLTLTGNAVVNGDVTAFASSLELGGKVGRDATLGGQNVTIDGTIGRNTTATDMLLTLGSAAHLGGTLDYTSKNDVQMTTGAVVAGPTQHHLPPAHEQRAQNGFVARFWGVAYWFGAFLLFGLVLLGFAPRRYRMTSEVMVKQGGWALLAGIVSLVMVPIIAVILMVTVIGIPLGITLIMLWLISMMASFVYSAYTIGEFIAVQASWKLKWPNAIALLLGLVILALLMLIPVVGGLCGFLALVWGLGGIVLLCGKRLKSRDGGTPARAKA